MEFPTDTAIQVESVDKEGDYRECVDHKNETYAHESYKLVCA